MARRLCKLISLAAAFVRIVFTRRISHFSPPFRAALWFSHRPRRYIDVGANLLQESSWVLEHHGPDVAIVAIEPNPRLVASYPTGDPRMIVVPCAIAPVERVVSLTVTADHQASSLADFAVLSSDESEVVRGNTSAFEVAASARISAVRLERVFASIPPSLTRIFVKVDAQGGDYEVLRSAGAALARAREIKMEMILKRIYAHDNRAEEGDVVELLARHGLAVAEVLDATPNLVQHDLRFARLGVPDERWLLLCSHLMRGGDGGVHVDDSEGAPRRAAEGSDVVRYC